MMFITVTFGGMQHSFHYIRLSENGVSGFSYISFYTPLHLCLPGLLLENSMIKKDISCFIPGALLILTAMLLLSWLPNNAVLYTAALLYGTGFGVIQPALQASSVAQAPANRRGMANATFFPFLI